MATTKKEEFGEMPCTNKHCESHAKNRPVIVSITEKGTLSFRCDKCLAMQYAPMGQKIRDDWLKDIKRSSSEPEKKQATPATPATPAAQPAPEPKKAGGLSFLGIN